MKILKILIVAIALFSIKGIAQTDFEAYTQEIEGTDVSFKMVPIEGGTLMLGASAKDKKKEADELPQKQVEISSFWMGVYEVTHKEFLLFTDATRDLLADGKPNPVVISRPSSPYEDPSKGLGDEDMKPTVGLTQYNALSYCRWLYKRTGVFYRIPTEAEWEFAAKAGTDTPYFFGKKKKDLDEYAWFSENANNQLHVVGMKKPNPNGLYDIYGNVSEWCLDQYYADFYTSIKDGEKDPRGFPDALYPRSVRGGSFIDDAAGCRSSNRITSTDDWKARDPQLPKSFWWNTDSEFVGFRLVRPLKQPSKEEAEMFFSSMLE
ncbi:formylglycine-generating enzyme family protein [Seonamhaeicola maritimus]|uniref:Formylglycine-generating enzyme family protein n=1 Tax=Seonamhaeicola maritimus TaxID=2591822 RepID=A0A5C7GEQ5_9FLAO|nr:formylglycine-generating enzyme family protein [Seonamhaeicola maritimus]TXG35207.1 formylglycine-generating enzyme family protein [Seonamhaeicola maritimus]